MWNRVAPIPPRRVNRGELGSLASDLIAVYLPVWGQQRNPNLAGTTGINRMFVQGYNSTIVVEASSSAAGSGAALTVSGLGTVDTWDVIVVSVSCEADATFTTPSGWTQINSSVSTAADNNVRTAMWWVRGQPSTWEWTLSTSVNWAWTACRLSGVWRTGSPVTFHQTNASAADVTTATFPGIDNSAHQETLTVGATGLNCSTEHSVSNAYAALTGSAPTPWRPVTAVCGTSTRYISSTMAYIFIEDTFLLAATAPIVGGTGRNASVSASFRPHTSGKLWEADPQVVGVGGRFWRLNAQSYGRGELPNISSRAAAMSVGWVGKWDEPAANTDSIKFSYSASSNFHRLLSDGVHHDGAQQGAGFSISSLSPTTVPGMFQEQTLLITHNGPNTLTLYRDGVTQFTWTTSNLPAVSESALWFNRRYGANYWADSRAAHQAIWLWNRALTATEVARWSRDPWVGLRG